MNQNMSYPENSRLHAPEHGFMSSMTSLSRSSTLWVGSLMASESESTRDGSFANLSSTDLMQKFSQGSFLPERDSAPYALQLIKIRNTIVTKSREIVAVYGSPSGGNIARE